MAEMDDVITEAEYARCRQLGLTPKDYVISRNNALFIGWVEPPKDLVAKAKALVDMLDDAERNHGSLVGTKTLTAVNELRIELQRWK